MFYKGSTKIAAFMCREFCLVAHERLLIEQFEIKIKGTIPVLAVHQAVTIDQTHDYLIAVMADGEVINHMRKIDKAIRHGKLGMIAQYSLGYNSYAFLIMVDGAKAHMAAKTIL